jgi:hypothetical protein
MSINDDIPVFRKGDHVSAGALNKLAEPLRQSILHPGQFQSANEQLQRRVNKPAGSGTEEIEVKITTEIPSATIDPMTGKWTPASITVFVLVEDSDGDLNASATISNEEREVLSFFKTPTPAPGDNKFRYGIASYIKGKWKLTQRECNVFDEPEVSS